MCSVYHTTEPIYNLLQLINDQIMFIFREKAVENQWLQRNRPQIYSTMAHLAKWLFLHIFSFYDHSKHQVFSATYFDFGPMSNLLGTSRDLAIGRQGHLVRALHSQRLHEMWQNCWRPMRVSKKMLG